MNSNSDIKSLLAEIKRLGSLVASLEKEVVNLQKRNTYLEAELARVRTKKDSSNTHIPPSQDISRKNRSLRRKGGRKPGGQKGHEGQTLKAVENPDKVEAYIPGYCNNCGKDLTDVPPELVGSRQTVELPPIKPLYVQHEVYRKKCKCGCYTQENFPSYATTPVSYGPSIDGLAGYLHTRQYVPYARMRELFRDVLGLPLSTGTLRSMVHRLAEKATPYYDQIKQRLKQAHRVGSDETSVKVNTRKDWMWVWQTDCLTFITHSDNRGFKTIERNFTGGLSNAVLQHDRYACHFKINAAAHQICLIHLQRDLQYIEDLYKGRCQWATELRDLIRTATGLKKEMTMDDYYKPHPDINHLEEKLDRLLQMDIDAPYTKAVSLQKSLRKHSNSILTFLYHPKVPPDNNSSERSIRNIKVKQKISGLFRSESGADDFAILRSITDTVLKSKHNVLEALCLIAHLQPE